MNKSFNYTSPRLPDERFASWYDVQCFLSEIAGCLDGLRDHLPAGPLSLGALRACNRAAKLLGDASVAAYMRECRNPELQARLKRFHQEPLECTVEPPVFNMTTLAHDEEGASLRLSP